jgi:uncharacterized protein
MRPPATDPLPATRPFWRDTPLAAMTRAQWESLCDGCGKCCLLKLEDEDSGRLYFTTVACRLLDHRTCRCTRYAMRTRLVDDCLKLTPENLHQGKLPPTCAYRLLAEGRDLPAWHPLVTGDPESTHRSGNSVRGRVVSESPDLDLTQHLLAADRF